MQIGKSAKYILLSEWFVILLFWLCFGVTVIILQYESASVELRITAKANRDSKAQIFWTQDDKGYAEQNSAILYVGPVKDELSFPLTFRGKIDRFRIDPLKDKGVLEISSAVLYQPFREPVDLFPALLSENFVPLQQGTIVRNENSITLKSSGIDPAFMLPCHVTAITVPGSILIMLGSLFLAILTYGLLNQKFIKGQKCVGTLSITLLQDQPLKLPPQLKDMQGRISPSGKEDYRRYLFHLESVNDRFILKLMSEIRIAHPDAMAVFHYNRAGEVQ